VNWIGMVWTALLGPETVRVTLNFPVGVRLGDPVLPPLLPLPLHPVAMIDPPTSRPHDTSRARSRVFCRCLRNPRTPAKLVKSSGQPRNAASAESECREKLGGRLAFDVAVGMTPGATSVQSVTPTVWALGLPGTGAKAREVGVTVQTELAGRPEHVKVTVPLSVLDGTTMTVANAVEPWAVPALKAATGARVVGEMKKEVKVGASG